MSYRFEDVGSVKDDLQKVDYLSDEGIAGVVYLADRLQKPILVEGPAGSDGRSTGGTRPTRSPGEAAFCGICMSVLSGGAVSQGRILTFHANRGSR